MLRCNSLIAALICLALLVSPCARGAGRSDRYLIELQVLVTDQKLTMDAHSVDTGGHLVSVGDINSMTVGDIELDLESDQLWNGEAAPPEDSGIELMTAPRLVVQTGEPAELRIGSAVQYLVQESEGCYAVETLPPDSSPGIFMEVVATAGPQSTDGAELVHLDFKIRIVTIGERAAVPGVNLDVGRPAGLHTQGIESTYVYGLDRWNVISGHLARGDIKADDEKLLVLVRVSRPPG